MYLSKSGLHNKFSGIFSISSFIKCQNNHFWEIVINWKHYTRPCWKSKLYWSIMRQHVTKCTEDLGSEYASFMSYCQHCSSRLVFFTFLLDFLERKKSAPRKGKRKLLFILSWNPKDFMSKALICWLDVSVIENEGNSNWFEFVIDQ